jgi:hypothetical protein
MAKDLKVLFMDNTWNLMKTQIPSVRGNIIIGILRICCIIHVFIYLAEGAIMTVTNVSQKA